MRMVERDLYVTHGFATRENIAFDTRSVKCSVISHRKATVYLFTSTSFRHVEKIFPLVLDSCVVIARSGRKGRVILRPMGIIRI